MKKVSTIFLLLVGVGSILVFFLIYFFSQAVFFTNTKSTLVDISDHGKLIEERQVYAVLEKLPEVEEESIGCPSQSGYCWFENGNMTIVSGKDQTYRFRLRISSTEVTRIWSGEPRFDEHDQFVERVVNALLTQGFDARIIEK